MKVVRAEAMGMCFGVKDALAIAQHVERPGRVTIHGQLVHNPEVNSQLRARGFQMISESRRADDAPGTDQVLVTAHGVSNAERARLLSSGATLIDTTCPLVRRAHRAAIGLERQGYFVIVIGKPDHIEVQGLTGDLKSFAVVESPGQVRDYRARKLGIVCQTTTPPRHVEAIRRAIERRNRQTEEIRLVDTVCRPTKARQAALERLLDQVDAVVIVGGRNSNNTRALLSRCRERGVPAWLVEHARELDSAWFVGIETVGLTAGTSTLDATIDEAHKMLAQLHESNTGRELEAVAATRVERIGGRQ